jgi:hypothetical protein
VGEHLSASLNVAILEGRSTFAGFRPNRIVSGWADGFEEVAPLLVLTLNTRQHKVPDQVHVVVVGILTLVERAAVRRAIGIATCPDTNAICFRKQEARNAHDYPLEGSGAAGAALAFAVAVFVLLLAFALLLLLSTVTFTVGSVGAAGGF